MATRINLLDWRAEQRANNKRALYVLLGIAVALAVVVVGLSSFIMSDAVENQGLRNQFLTAQIAEMDKKSKEIEELERIKANLLARMKVVEQLQQSRSATVHFFDEIINTLPQGVFLTSIKQQGQSVTLEGVAESNGRVSTYMKNLDASPWFDSPELVVIKTGEQNKLRQSQFTLKVKNLTQSTEGKKGTGGAAP